MLGRSWKTSRLPVMARTRWRTRRSTSRIAAAKRLDHVGVGVGCEGRDRRFGRLVDHRLVDANALQAAGRGDGAVDRDLPGELHVDGAADVEEDGAIQPFATKA